MGKKIQFPESVETVVPCVGLSPAGGRSDPCS